MTSVLNVDTIADKAGTGPVAFTKQEAAKMYFRYNQVTPALETGSLNVSSVSDDAKGRFTASITSNMSDALYAITGFAGEHGGQNEATWMSKYFQQNDYSTSAAPYAVWYYAGDVRDKERCSSVLFGDLA